MIKHGASINAKSFNAFGWAAVYHDTCKFVCRAFVRRSNAILWVAGRESRFGEQVLHDNSQRQHFSIEGICSRKCHSYSPCWVSIRTLILHGERAASGLAALLLAQPLTVGFSKLTGHLHGVGLLCQAVDR